MGEQVMIGRYVDLCLTSGQTTRIPVDTDTCSREQARRYLKAAPPSAKQFVKQLAKAHCLTLSQAIMVASKYYVIDAEAKRG